MPMQPRPSVGTSRPWWPSLRVLKLIDVSCCRRGAMPGLTGYAERASGRRPMSRGYRSEEHTSELQSLMRISYAVFCLKKQNKQNKIKQVIRIQRTHETMYK